MHVKFCRSIAHRIADEQWHPEQKGRTLPSGEYEMEIPYNLDKNKTMEHRLFPSLLPSIHYQYKIKRWTTDYLSVNSQSLNAEIRIKL